jgi:outer membrane protein TolC
VDCRALAVKNNYDVQVARFEEAGAGEASKGRLKRILPRIIFNGTLSDRSNPGYGYSEVLGREGIPVAVAPGFILPGVNPYRYVVGRQRTTWRYDVGLNWNLNQSTQDYFLAKNLSNNEKAAYYRKLRTIQEVVGQVDAAYFRLLVYQQALPIAKEVSEIRSYVADIKRGLFDRRIIELEELTRAREQYVRTNLAISQIENEILRQRNILGSLMDVSPDCTVDGGFYVVGSVPKKIPGKHLRGAKVGELEMAAVRNRPEAYQAVLEYLNATNDIKRSFMQGLPELSTYWRFVRDHDHYLYENDWNEVGVQIRFDLLEFFASKDDVRAARRTRDSKDNAVGAMVTQITSQVRDAALRYFDALARVKSARANLKNARQILKLAKNKEIKGDLDRVTLEDSRATALSRKIELVIALGEANALYAELQKAMANNYYEPPET